VHHAGSGRAIGHLSGRRHRLAVAADLGCCPVIRWASPNV
jgi:hypothetical protein